MSHFEYRPSTSSILMQSICYDYMLKVKYENTDIDAAYIALGIVNKKFLLKKKMGKMVFIHFFRIFSSTSNT